MEYFKHQLKNFYDEKFITRNFSSSEQSIIRDIKKYGNTPHVFVDIALLLKSLLKDIKTTDDELKEYVEISVFHIKMGDANKIFETLLKYREN